MKFKNLLDDNDAVSPVIGVILMVAITVILAAVIGTFVLGLGDQVSNTSPTASFSFDFEKVSSPSGDCTLSTGLSGDNGELTITHDGGNEIDGDLVQITDGSNTASWTSGTGSNCGAGSPVSAGSSVVVESNTASTVRVTWQSSNGDDTSTLGKWTGPDA